MPFSAAQFVTDYLETKYPSEKLAIINGCCRTCLRGTPVVHDLKRTSISTLIKSSTLEPFLTINAIHTGSAYHAAYLKDKIINVRSDPEPCHYPGNCNLTCLTCRSLILNQDGVEVEIWPGFKVHRACASPCLYPGCKTFLPTLPVYLGLQRAALMCEAHKDTDAFRKLSISAAPVSRAGQTMPVKNPPKQTKQPSPPAPPKLDLTPAKLEQPPRKTFQFKKQQLAKADKFQERGKSKNILTFFHAQASKPDKQTLAAAVKATSTPGEERRFLRNKETGEIFGYWKGNQAYHIDTDELLFNRDKEPQGRPVKLDFTAPP
jgi:hypothetical protein